MISNAENVALLNVDIPAVISTGQSSHSPRSGTSPRTQVCLKIIFLLEFKITMNLYV